MLLFMLVFFLVATAASVGLQTYFLSFFEQNAGGWAAFGAAFVAALVPALVIVFVNVGLDALRNRPRSRSRRRRQADERPAS